MENVFFISCWSRPDLKTALDLLAMLVRNPGRDGNKKLARAVCYIRAARGMDINLWAESMDTL